MLLCSPQFRAEDASPVVGTEGVRLTFFKEGYRMEKEIEKAVHVINSGGRVDQKSLSTLFDLLEKGIHWSSMGTCEERCRAIDRLRESRFWVQEGFKS